jgi:Na+-transporting methylmalonyl-CoA/oxaloacetate decarboxylase gamma subunit
MNNLDLILAVSGPAAEVQSSETMEIVVVGFAFVMVVLVLLALVTASIGAVFRRYDAKITAKAEAAVAAAVAAANLAPKPAPVASPEAISCEDEDPALMAVLAAAVHSVIGDRAHRIVSIRPGGPGWAQEGRRQIFSSHRVR